jgi:membrane associated rhomboid family serine protease
VYGLLLAFGVYFPHRRVLLLFPPIPLPARVFVILFAALELVFGVTGTAAGVAHFAHLGGMIGGWLMIQYRRGGFPFRT